MAPFKETGVVNEIQASIAGTTHTDASVPTYEEGYDMFFSQAFVENVL
jgi:hypothetical protein